MKTLLSVLFLVGLVSAQIQDASPAGAPMQLAGIATAGMTAKNVASKDIIAFVVSYGPNSFTFNRDFYFQPAGIAPGATRPMVELGVLPPKLLSQFTSGTLIYVQFVDGTEWGDLSSGHQSIANRKAYLALDSQVVSAYGTGGQSAVEALLNSTANDPQQNPDVSGMASTLLSIEKNKGIDWLLNDVNLELTSAAAHDKTLHP
jgi:hypothetical protein